ncbi:SHOCT domain-containing protein [Bacillus sp. BGMRC 2118]|nr:SHOCT domain-containing protein [Bacillus sp. BGMRC 2118]
MYRVKPSKGASLLGVIVGVIFIFIGITQVSTLGGFGIIWTLIAVAITGFHAINAFSTKGVSSYEVDVELSHDYMKTAEDIETELRKLHRLKEDQIISEEEYHNKKEELLNRW